MSGFPERDCRPSLCQQLIDGGMMRLIAVKIHELLQKKVLFTD
jgi:hypothetical protein